MDASWPAGPWVSCTGACKSEDVLCSPIHTPCVGTDAGGPRGTLVSPADWALQSRPG